MYSFVGYVRKLWLIHAYQQYLGRGNIKIGIYKKNNDEKNSIRYIIIRYGLRQIWATELDFLLDRLKKCALSKHIIIL